MEFSVFSGLQRGQRFWDEVGRTALGMEFTSRRGDRGEVETAPDALDSEKALSKLEGEGT